MPTQRLEEKRVEEHVGEGERERKSTRMQERERERERERASERARLWLLLLYVFFLPWACPLQIRLSQECCLFYLKSSLWSSDLLLFHFCGLSLPCLIATAILDSFSLFYLPNIPLSRDGRPNSLGIGASRSFWLLPAELGW